MRTSVLVMTALAALSVSVVLRADEESAQDFMQLHKVEIAFHEAGSTKNLKLMSSLFTDDAVLIAKGKTYTGKSQIKTYWSTSGISTRKSVDRLYAGVSHPLLRAG